jgi:O-antigen/teichoic acid export membrane protein
LSIDVLASFLTKMGFDKAHLKRVSEGLDLATCMGTWVRIKLGLIIVFAGLVLAGTVWWHFRVGFLSTAVSVVLAILVYYALMALRAIPEISFDALRLTASTQLMNIVENVVRAPLVVGVALFYGLSRERWVPLRSVPAAVERLVERTGPLTVETGATLLALAFLVGMLASLVSGLVMMKRHHYPIGAWDMDLARSYAAFALPIAAFHAMKTMTYHIDGVMLGYFWSEIQVGYYGAAQRYVTIALIIPTAVRTLFFPIISKMAKQERWKEVDEVATSAQRFMSLIMVYLVLLVLVFAADVLRIFVSAAFVPAAPAFQLLMVHTALVAFTTISSSLVMGLNRPGLVALIGTGAVALNVSLNLVFIPTSILGVPMLGLQHTGAALASVIAQTVSMVVLFIVSHRILGTTHLSVSILKHLIAAGAAYALLWAGLHLCEPSRVLRFYELAAGTVLATLLYVGLLWFMRELTRKDVHFFMDLLHPGRMGEYVKDELRGGKSR